MHRLYRQNQMEFENRLSGLRSSGAHVPPRAGIPLIKRTPSQPFSSGTGLPSVQDLPNLCGQGVKRERLWEESHFGMYDAVAKHRVVVITALKKYL